jgi:WD repeat-containing protein 55
MEDKPVPEDISCADQVFDIAFHPTSNFLATGLITGGVELWKYGPEESANQMLFSSDRLKSSCRGVRFNEAGTLLYYISSDKSLRGMDGNGAEIFHYAKAHDSPLNRICCVTENTLVTGDDAGEVKLWDLRMGGSDTAAVMQWHLHEDFISGFAYHADATALISVSGDSTLCMYDFKNKKNHVRSDEQESELQCVQVLKGGKKIVAGTQDGVMLLFSWDRWGDCSDRYPGHPEAVDCMWKIDESTVLTGSSDGLIRVVSLHPNKILGVIGDHEDFPVEGLCASREGNLLGSFAHDEVVRFWDISLFTEDDGEEFDEDVGEESMQVAGDKAGAAGGAGAGGGRKKGRKAAAVGDAAMTGEEEEEDSDDEDDEEDEDDMELDDVEEGDEEEEDASMDDSGDDDDDDDDDSDDDGAGKGPKKLPTAAEKFFADL